MGKDRTVGLATLNQNLMRGIPSYCRVSGGRMQFSASLTLLDLVKNGASVEPLPRTSLIWGGVHVIPDTPGDS